MDVVRRTSYFKGFNFSFFFTSSRFIQLCTFLVFGLTGDVLTAEKAFLVASMYSIANQSMACYFPFAISQIGEAKASIKRIQVKRKGLNHAKNKQFDVFSEAAQIEFCKLNSIELLRIKECSVKTFVYICSVNSFCAHLFTVHNKLMER